MAKILVRNGSAKWEKASETRFADEVELQNLLYESPELIEREDDGPIVFTKESSLPGSGSTDLIGVASNGDILLVETKLAKNPEIRRKVIGQILEYGAFLWGMEYASFDSFFVQREGKGLIELLSEHMPDINPEEFRKTVSENLSAGRFHLLIAVDEINKELEKIVAYVSRNGGDLKLEALEVHIYNQGQISVFVPQRFRQLTQPSLPPTRTAAPTLLLEEVLTKPTQERTRGLLRHMVAQWKEMGHPVEPGTSGLSCKADIDGTRHPLVWALPGAGDWYIEPIFGGLSKRGAPPEAVKDYRKAVSELPGLPGKKCLTEDRPTAQFAQLNEQSIQSLLMFANEVVERWRASETSHEA